MDNLNVENLEKLFCEKPNESDSKLELENMDHIYIFMTLFKQLMLNPLFSGTILVSTVGFLWYFVTWGKDFVVNLFKQHFIQSLELTNENIVYPWVIEHINKNSRWETRNLSVKTTYDSEEGTLDHKFLPGHGSHYFYYKDRWINVDRHREKRNVDINDEISGRYETKQLEIVKLSTWGASPTFWQEFIDEASAEGLNAIQKGVQIYYAQDGNYWNNFGKPRRKRTLESVVLSNGLSEKIYNDVKNFLESGDWYNQRGVPYRRGYLLYGPPGTGKSSFIAALASHFGYGVCMLSLNEKLLTDSAVNYLINNTNNKTFILLEDVDAAFLTRESSSETSSTDTIPLKPDSTPSITLSGLLNAIDGVASSEERIIFMTTNYKERLDSALIRPGRIDFQAYFGHCTPDMVEKMFKRFYENADEKMVEKFVEETSKLEKTFSPAELQRHLIFYKNEPQEAIDNVHNI